MHHFVAIPEPDDRSDGAIIDAQQAEAIKRWTRDYLKLNPDAVITVSEFACRDPGCPIVETVIAVFDDKQTRRWKLTRPKAAVTKLMVQQTLRSNAAAR